MKKILLISLLALVLCSCDKTIPKPELKIQLPNPPSYCEAEEVANYPPIKRGEDLRAYADRLKVYIGELKGEKLECYKWILGLVKEYQ